MTSLPDRPRVLIVDDNAIVRRALKMLMVTIGWEVSEAANAHEAQVELKRSPCALAIIDINMPGITGIELCEWIHSPANETVVPKVFILSGVIDAKRQEAAFKAGATSVIRKPFEFQELIDEIKKHRIGVPSGTANAS